jgi:peptide/nickel transport system permease protein
MQRNFPYFSVGVVISIVLLSSLGAIFYDHSPSTFDKESILLPPSLQHPMGTDRLGRDVLARVIEGGKISLLIGVG